MMSPSTQKGVRHPLPLSAKWEQKQFYLHRVLVTVKNKLEHLYNWENMVAGHCSVCEGGGTYARVLDETLHGEDVLGDTLRLQQCLQTHRSDQVLCWDFVFHYLP